MDSKKVKPATCPLCGRTYTGVPATTRTDNTTLICPGCGTREALADMGIGEEEQERILEIIHRCHPQ